MRLEQLFDKTRDAMVAFELAQLEELSGRMDRATEWYKRAWQRFRRAEWKQKAEEALVRLGISIESLAELEPPTDSLPVVLARPESEEAGAEVGAGTEAGQSASTAAEHPGILSAAAEAEFRVSAAEPGVSSASGLEPEAGAQDTGQPRRRRHRGGRGRGRGRRKAEAPVTAQQSTETAAVQEEAAVAAPAQPRRSREPERRAGHEHRPEREPISPIHVYRQAEPALASKIKALEAKLRQVIAAQPQSMTELSEVPANPGILLVSDHDLTTVYYLEACGNLRSAMDQLMSGRRGRQGAVRSRLAKYLGVNDSQASRYMKEHCVARWIALEESDANALGHFARGVLRPELMEGED